MLLFCLRTSWGRGWPLLARPFGRSPEIWLLFLGSQMIWTITLIQVTALTFAATRETSHAVSEMEAEDRRDDLFPLPLRDLRRLAPADPRRVVGRALICGRNTGRPAG